MGKRRIGDQSNHEEEKHEETQKNNNSSQLYSELRTLHCSHLTVFATVLNLLLGKKEYENYLLVAFGTVCYLFIYLVY